MGINTSLNENQFIDGIWQVLDVGEKIIKFGLDDCPDGISKCGIQPLFLKDITLLKKVPYSEEDQRQWWIKKSKGDPSCRIFWYVDRTLAWTASETFHIKNQDDEIGFPYMILDKYDMKNIAQHLQLYETFIMHNEKSYKKKDGSEITLYVDYDLERDAIILKKQSENNLV